VDTLAGDDECGATRRGRTAADKPPCREDGNEECKRRQQIDMSGVVTAMADFPAHLFLLLLRGHQVNATPPMRVPLESGAAVSGFEWTLQGPLTPRHRPNRHGRYHRACGGNVSGTLSIPEVPQG
jgi:hypothetical protein